MTKCGILFFILNHHGLPVFKVIKTSCSWKTRVWQFQLLWKSKTCNLFTKKRHLSISSQAGLLLHSKVYRLNNWQERIIQRLQSSPCVWFILPLLSLAGVYELRCVTKDEKQENYNEIHNSKPWKLDGFGWTYRSRIRWQIWNSYNEWQLKYPNSSDRTFQHIDGTW